MMLVVGIIIPASTWTERPRTAATGAPRSPRARGSGASYRNTPHRQRREWPPVRLSVERGPLRDGTRRYVGVPSLLFPLLGDSASRRLERGREGVYVKNFIGALSLHAKKCKDGSGGSQPRKTDRPRP
jgi:hypothetical protein